MLVRRQRQRRGAGLGRRSRASLERARTWTACRRARQAGLHAQALPLRAWPSSSGCSPPPSCWTTRPLQIATAARALPAAELRPRLPGPGQRAHGARRIAQRPGGARRCDARRPRRASSSGCAALGLRRACSESGDYYGSALALGSGRRDPAASWSTPTARSPTAARWAPLRGSPARRGAGGRARVSTRGAACHRRRHPRRPRARAAPPSAWTARWPRAVLGGGEDRHQQGHARQLVHRLLRRATRSASGSGNFDGRADARRVRASPARRRSG
ncbi:MAG: hypothetical protein MZV65_37480 [Chromatiales bacterium]|nr:hypothetical protein [Chromatiales bacterium]